MSQTNPSERADRGGIRTELMTVPEPRDKAFVARVIGEVLEARARCREMLSPGEEQGRFDRGPLEMTSTNRGLASGDYASGRPAPSIIRK